MAEMTSFLLCNSIQDAPGPIAGQTIPALIAPQLVLRPDFIPSNFSFGISLGVSGVDIKKDIEVRSTIEDPDGKLVFDSGVNKLPKGPETEDLVPEEYQGIMMTMDIRNMLIEKEGCFKYKFYLDGTQIAEKDIPIYKRKS